MNKEAIMNDMDFRSKCVSYGLDWDNFFIKDNTIVLNTPKQNVFVLLDENYNTIGVHSNNSEKPEEKVKRCIRTYNKIYTDADNDYGYELPYPFQNYSLKQFLDISKLISFRETNHGHSSETSVNGINIDDFDEDSKALLSYIMFLSDLINEYYVTVYHMTILGYECPDIYSYTNNLNSRIRECINTNIKENNRPFPVDVINFIGLNNDKISNHSNELFDIISLLLKERGYKETSNSIEPGESLQSDLSITATTLLLQFESAKKNTLESYKKELTR